MNYKTDGLSNPKMNNFIGSNNPQQPSNLNQEALSKLPGHSEPNRNPS